MKVNVVFVTTRHQACKMYVFSINNVSSRVLGLQDKLYEVTANVISVFTSSVHHLNQSNGNFLKGILHQKIFLLPKSYILDSNGVWYSSFWPEGPKNN